MHLPDGSKFRPSKGDVYFLPSGEDQLYFSDSDNPWTKIWCNFSGQFVDQMVKLYHLENIRVIPQCNIEAEMREFLAIATDPSLSRPEIWEREELQLHKILQILARHVHPAPTQLSEQARILQEHIDRNLDQSVSMHQLSQLVSLSPSQITRLFKSAFQTTPYEYLLSRRAAMAKELLRSTNLSVKEIAYSLGFSDEHYFSTFFRKRTGTAPLSYRKSKP